MCNDHKALFMERKHVAGINVVNPKKTRDIPANHPKKGTLHIHPLTHQKRKQDKNYQHLLTTKLNYKLPAARHHFR